MNLSICCIKCEKPLETWAPGGDGFCFVDNAVRFNSHGNYGSTVLDMHPHAVEIYLCDECFVRAATNKMMIEVHKTTTKSTTSYHLYSPNA